MFDCCNDFVIANGQCTSLLHIIMFYDKKVNSPIFTNAKYIYIYTDSGQKYFYACEFPYVFHIKLWFFK